MDVNEPSARYFAHSERKRTAIGSLPHDWALVSLDSVSRVTSGKRLPLGASLTDSDTGHPYIRVSDMTEGTVRTSDIRFVPANVAPLISRYRVFASDLFISVAGTLGLIGRVPAELEGANLTENADRISDIACDRDFLFHVLASRIVQSVIEAERTVGAQPKLALVRLRKFAVPIPPSSEEQRSIAEVLDIAGCLVASLEQLVTKKRQIKQGAMQELLTGKKRLPGFTAEWKAVCLRELGRFLKGSGVTREQAQSGPLACVRYGEIYTDHDDVIRAFKSRVSRAVAATATQLAKGDLLFAGSGETKEEIGKCVAFVSDEEAYAGGDVVILRPARSDSTFLGYLMNSPAVVRQKASRGQGDAVVHISSSALGDVSLELPELAEQVAITSVLTDLDAELTALETKLAKARALKHAMSEALLTGRIRLRPPAAAAA